jgi:diguanylate cyclase (GGDEF)-like protein
MHRLFAEQLQKARTKSGVVDLARLGEIVSDAYDEAEREIQRTDRSIALMIEELDQLNRELEEQIRERTADLRTREAELAAQNARFETAVNNMSQALLLMDESARMLMCNKRYVDLYRVPPELVRPGTRLVDLLAARIKNGTWAGNPQEYVDKVMRVLAGGNSATWLTDLPDGRSISVLIHPLPGGGWVTTHEDITERRVAEMRIAHMARHDGLTSLANREYLRERLAEAASRLGDDERLAVLYLDLDQFKGINDTLGHSIGDELLKAVADRLKAITGEHDIVARIGGDEFVIVRGGVAGREEAAELAERVSTAVSAPFQLSGHVVATETSIGVSFAPDDATEPNDLLKHADMALYRAKAERRGSWRVFEPEMDQRIKTRHALEQDLRDALINGEFEVHYQPVINVRSRRIVGCEALIRWRHPARGLVPSSDFIPIAEEMGLIVSIGDWVIRQACAEAALWPSDVKIAVNLSPVQLLNPRLIQVVVIALAAAGIAPSRLELEITETVLMHNTTATLSALHRLREIGVSISMDDFGTGYSSLSNLRSYPFDKIKIDRCFVAGLPAENDSAAIIRAVVGLARGLKMTTTAEGVETAEQAEQIKALGCNEIQGHYFSPARPAIEVRQLLARQMPRLAKSA